MTYLMQNFMHFQRFINFLFCRSMFSFADFIQATWVFNLSVSVNDFLKTKVTDFRRLEESTSWNRLTSLIIFFSIFFRVTTSSLFVSAWISSLMIKFDFSNRLILATHKSHIRLHWMFKKSSIDCWEKISFLIFVLIKTSMSLIVQFNSLLFFFSITS